MALADRVRKPTEQSPGSRTSAVWYERCEKSMGTSNIFFATFTLSDSNKIYQSITERIELRYNTRTCIGAVSGCYEATIPYDG